MHTPSRGCHSRPQREPPERHTHVAAGRFDVSPFRCVLVSERHERPGRDDRYACDDHDRHYGRKRKARNILEDIFDL